MTDPEIAANALAFRAGLAQKLASNLASTEETSAIRLDEAYGRLTSLQAWRLFVLDSRLPAPIVSFYSEAQNDGLTSIVLAATGLWRPSLKSLRSLIENVLHCLYYKDHPIEYRQWEQEKFRPTFKELFDYFGRHPDVSKVKDSIHPVNGLRETYKHLSTYVHASSKEVRMTDDLGQANLWKTSATALGKWAAAQKNVLRDVNLLLLCTMAEHVQGAAAKGLREAVARTIPSNKDRAIQTELGIRLVRGTQ